MQKKQIAILIVLLAFTTAACLIANSPSVSSTPAPKQTSDVVFKTPEEAIQSYFEGLAVADTQKILQSCAIDEMSEKFDFGLYTERLGGILMPIQSLAPSSDPFYVETNKAQLSSQTLSRVKIFVYSLLSSENISDASPITGMDAERTSKFLKDVDPKRLSSLKVEKIGLPNPTLMKDAKYLENAAKIAHVYGADEATERVALFSFEGKTYYLGFTLLRYGDNWKIGYAASGLSNANVMGSPEPITIDEFESMINGN